MPVVRRQPSVALGEQALAGPGPQDGAHELGLVAVLREIGELADGSRIAPHDGADLGPEVRRVSDADGGLRLVVELLAPARQILLGRRLHQTVEVDVDHLAHALRDAAERHLDDVAQPADPLVVPRHLEDLVEDRLLAGDAGDGTEHGRDRAGPAVLRRLGRSGRIRLEVEQAPVDLHAGRALADGADHMAERPVVEHAAVDEVALVRVRLRELVEPEEPLGSRQACSGPDRGLELAQAHGRERARERGRRPRREREPAVVGAREVVGAVAPAEPQDMPVRAVVHQRRVADHELTVVACEVRGGHEQLELVVVGHERRELGRPRSPRVHGFQCLVEPARHRVAVQRRSRARDQQQAECSCSPRDPGRAAQELGDVAALDPDVAQLLLGPVVRQRLCQIDAVDAARGRAGDDIDHHARAHAMLVVLLYEAEQPPIHALRRRVVVRTESSVLERRRLHQAMQLLGHAVHVDGERDAAVQHDGEPDFAHSSRLEPLRHHGHPLAAGPFESTAGSQGSRRPGDNGGFRRKGPLP